mmetsp:Transcript_145467/g.253889  ORF Transcript_145467/g.253889 Transcript_145467/m.253889 type:complete len:251 (-) Transcript_145467:258-1010(-)
MGRVVMSWNLKRCSTMSSSCSSSFSALYSASSSTMYGAPPADWNCWAASSSESMSLMRSMASFCTSTQLRCSFSRPTMDSRVPSFTSAEMFLSLLEMLLRVFNVYLSVVGADLLAYLWQISTSNGMPPRLTTCWMLWSFFERAFSADRAAEKQSFGRSLVLMMANKDTSAPLSRANVWIFRSTAANGTTSESAATKILGVVLCALTTASKTLLPPFLANFEYIRDLPRPVSWVVLDKKMTAVSTNATSPM